MTDDQFDDLILNVETATDYQAMRDYAELAISEIAPIRKGGDYASWKSKHETLAEAVLDWVLENADPDGEEG